jgi:16S rRNA (cytosine1402-N4)-methyltransferase
LKQKNHPAKKTFQALRVYVNNEIDALEKSLIQSLELLKSKGRIAIITFQSHEENVVRRVLKLTSGLIVQNFEYLKKNNEEGW